MAHKTWREIWRAACGLIAPLNTRGPYWCDRPRLTAAISRCSLQARRGTCLERGRSGGFMFGLGDLFQWERFVTPTVIKVFYWLAVVISVLLGFAGVVSSLT